MVFNMGVFVPIAKSYGEHLIHSTGCHTLFYPYDYHPNETQSGTMQDVISYILYPNLWPRPTPTPKFIKTVMDNVPPFHHKDSGIFFPSNTLSDSIKKSMLEVVEYLMPNDLNGAIKLSQTAKEINNLLNSLTSMDAYMRPFFDELHWRLRIYVNIWTPETCGNDYERSAF